MGLLLGVAPRPCSCFNRFANGLILVKYQSGKPLSLLGSV